MANLRVVSIEKLDVQAQNETILNITVDLFDETGTLETRKLGFPLALGTPEIQTELAKFLETYNGDVELRKKNAALDEAHKQADATIEELQGVTLEGIVLPDANTPATE